MARKLPDLVGDRAIIQGESWNHEKHTGIAFPGGDWTLWTPSGQIRTNLKGLTNTLIAEFDWGDPLWDEQQNLTVFYPQLSASVTQEMPVTRYQGEGILSVRNALIYDMEIALESVVMKGSFAYVQVIGEVTYVSN